jgi:hypothetical protein
MATLEVPQWVGAQQIKDVAYILYTIDKIYDQAITRCIEKLKKVASWLDRAEAAIGTGWAAMDSARRRVGVCITLLEWTAESLTTVKEWVKLVRLPAPPLPPAFPPPTADVDMV